jgi:hypothetical protein
MSTVMAAPAPVEIDIPKLERSSDVICVAGVTSAIPGKDGVVVQCANVLSIKGDSRQDFTVLLGLSNSVTPGTVAFFFLRKDDDGSYVLTDKTMQLVVLPSFAKEADDISLPVGDRVIRQLQVVVNGNEPTWILRALDAAERIKYRLDEESLWKLNGHADVALASTALRLLVDQRQPQAIRKAIDVLTLGDAPRNEAPQLERLAWAVQKVADSVSVEDANKIAQVSNPAIATFGVRILREVGDRSSVPVLMWQLSEARGQVQYDALVALCRITKRPGPSWKEFFDNPDIEVTKWKEWWKLAKDEYGGK